MLGETGSVCAKAGAARAARQAKSRIGSGVFTGILKRRSHSSSFHAFSAKVRRHVHGGLGRSRSWSWGLNRCGRGSGWGLGRCSSFWISITGRGSRRGIGLEELLRPPASLTFWQAPLHIHLISLGYRRILQIRIVAAGNQGAGGNQDEDVADECHGGKR